MAKKSSYLLVICILASCGGVSDYSLDLGDGYSYLKLGKDYDFVSGEFNVNPEIDSLAYNDESILVVQKASYEGIMHALPFELGRLHTKFNPNENISIDTDDNMYRISEKDSLLLRIMSKKGYVGDNKKKDRKIREELADSLIKNDPYYLELLDRKYNYWIIDKTDAEIYGPMDRIDFLKAKKKLGIGHDLKLQRAF